MSAAIRALHLEQPPTTVEHLTDGDWQGHCSCGDDTSNYTLLSGAINELNVHSDFQHDNFMDVA